jgi:hypothetical protein
VPVEKLEDPPGVSLDTVDDGAYDDPEYAPDGWAAPEEPEEPEEPEVPEEPEDPAEPEDSGDDEADCDEV